MSESVETNGELSQAPLEIEGNGIGSSSSEAPPIDDGSATAPTAPAAKLIESWKSGSIPFLNKPFIKFVQLALVLGGAAVLVDNYFVADEVRTGIETTTYTDSFSRGDLTEFGSQSIGTLKSDYFDVQQWVQFTAGFGQKSAFEDVFGVSQDQAALFRAPKGKGAIFATVGGFVAPTTIEARIVIPAIDAGLVFRYVNEKNWWAIVNDPLNGRFRILRTIDGVTEDVGDTGKNSILGSGYRLTIRLDDKGFDIFQNGSPIIRVEDDSLANADARSAGLFALSSRAVGARWDDFVMREPAAKTLKTARTDFDTDSVTPTSIVVPESPSPEELLASGASGAASLSGASGASGASGSSGPSGVSGASGASGPSGGTGRSNSKAASASSSTTSLSGFSGGSGG